MAFIISNETFTEEVLRVDLSDVLRRLALDESVKARVAADPVHTELLRKVARRYVSGTTRQDALAVASALNAAGHAVTIDYMGESTRSAAEADAALTEFLALTDAITTTGARASVSLDLSHLGSQLDRQRGLDAARRLAAATQRAGLEMHLSMEGHERVPQVLDDHAALCEEFSHVGITVQARLHRTADDLARLLGRPGRIRLVKGAYDVPATEAVATASDELGRRFDEYATTLLTSGHPCAIATHDEDRIAHARSVPAAGDHYYEVQQGIGDILAADLHAAGCATQVYVVYGTQEWLYVCHRMAEDPRRLVQAATDLIA
jgi:proline dehydrogenase